MLINEALRKKFRLWMKERKSAKFSSHGFSRIKRITRIFTSSRQIQIGKELVYVNAIRSSAPIRAWRSVSVVVGSIIKILIDGWRFYLGTIFFVCYYNSYTIKSAFMNNYDESASNEGMREPEWWKRIRDEINNWFNERESNERNKKNEEAKSASKPISHSRKLNWRIADFSRAFDQQHWN